MNHHSQGSAGVTSFVVAALVLVLIAGAAGVLILELAPAAPKTSSNTSGGVSSTTSTRSTISSSSSFLETSHVSCPNQSSSTSSSSEAQGYGLENPVGIGVFFNGSIFQGPMMGFTVVAGSSSAIDVSVTYPWSGLPSSPSGACIPVSFAIGPFPADSKQSTIPGWLEVSLSSPSGAITPDSNASVDLRVTADSSAPQGATGSFELLVTYLDPASGDNVTDGNVLNLVASSSKPAGTLTQTCCSSNVTSVTLGAPASPGGPANLTLTVLNSGYYPVGPLEAFVENGTVPPGNNPPPDSGITFYNGTIPANGTMAFSIAVPTSVATVVPGGQYTVVVQIEYVGAAGGVFQFSTHRTVVTATQ